MLQYVRNKSSSKFASVLLVLMAVAIGFWGVQSFFGSSSNSTKIAKIGDSVISQQDFIKILHRSKLMKSHKDWLAIENNNEKRLWFRKKLLSTLIYQQGLMAGLDNYNYDIVDSQVQYFLLNMPLFKVKNKFDFHYYQLLLSKLDMTEDDLINEIKLSLILDQLKSVFNYSFTLLPKEVEDYKKLAAVSYNFKVIKVMPNLLAKQKISKERIKDFYIRNKKLFTNPEFWGVNYVYIPFDLIKKSIQVNSAEALSFYKNNIKNYTVADKYKLHTMHLRLVQSQDLAMSKADLLENLKQMKMPAAQYEEVLTLISKDFWTVSVNSNNEWQLLPANGRANDIVNNLNLNQFSKVVKFNDKDHLLVQLLGHKPKFIKPFSKVKEQVEAAILQQKFSEIMVNTTDEISEKIYTNPSSLKPLADSFKVKVESVNLDLKIRPKNSLFSNDKVWHYVNKKNVLIVGENSDIIELENGWLIINPQKHNLPTVKKLSLVESTITKILNVESANEQALNLAETINNLLVSGKPMKKILKENKLNWQSVDNINQLAIYNSKYPVNFLKKALALSSDKSDLFQFPSGEVWIIKPIKTTVDKINDQALKKQVESLEQQLAKLELNLLQSGLLLDKKVNVFIDDNKLSIIN